MLRTRRRDGGEGHAQYDRGEGPAGRADAPFAARQGAHCHGDHQGVVAGQQQVDQHDREDIQQELAGSHGALGRAGRAGGFSHPGSGAPEIAPRHAYVFEDLRLQRLGVFEAALVADEFEEVHADAARRGASERIEQKGLDGQLVARRRKWGGSRCW